ncbi:hypothetical protein C8Q72DRAFT_866538 [Fomitopsis betulina]|nr:hypothetical protein C8Q72DRAFT_866538 [Fomitopsis betulina]
MTMIHPTSRASDNHFDVEAQPMQRSHFSTDRHIDQRKLWEGTVGRLWQRIAGTLGWLWGRVTGRQFVPDAADECQVSDAPYTRAENDIVRANEEHRKATREREDARLQIQAAESALHEALAGRAEAEDAECKGIRPVVWPSATEVNATKARIHYTAGLHHVAISGIAGSGRSSLVNAFLGLRNSDRDAAPTGVADSTTLGEVARFPDPIRHCVWYDIPGAGTLSVPDWKYFTDQGLYIFESIIVLFDARLTETDVAILRNAVRFKIPTYIVRSKALQHIRNLAADTPADESGSSEEESEDTSALRLERARETYIRETRANIAENLRTAELPEQRVYFPFCRTSLARLRSRSASDSVWLLSCEA